MEVAEDEDEEEEAEDRRQKKSRGGIGSDETAKEKKGRFDYFKASPAPHFGRQKRVGGKLIILDYW